MPGPKLYTTKVKSVGVVYRRQTPQAEEAAADVVKWLAGKKIEALSHPDQTIKGAKKLRSAADIQLVVVLGGDGTYLEAVRMLDGERVPVLGVNMGHLGFLTVNRAQDLYKMLESAVKGELEVRSRSMIRVTLIEGKKRQSFVGLNDLVIERGPLSRLIHISITIDKQPITSLKADGLIVATPTGSTAYNLAAGGPILHPEVNALVVTPICPHSLTSRPFIFPDERTIRFTTDENAVVSVDGVKVANLDKDNEICVERDECDHLLLRKPGHNYFSLLKDKLKFGER